MRENILQNSSWIVTLFVGRKYCTGCEYYFITIKIFCQCCGIQLRATPTEKEYKEKVNERRRLGFEEK
jgi:rRNA maturation endonuclease Nob1